MTTPTPNTPRPENVRQGAAATGETPTALSALTLFSGGGGFDMGLIGAGYRIIGAVELDKAIADVYRMNFGDTHLIEGDVRDVDYTRYRGVKYAHLSPPCPEYSNAKSNKSVDHSDAAILNLYLAGACADCIRDAQPDFVSIENVPGYAGSQSLQIILDELQEQGYIVDGPTVYNSADYGGKVLCPVHSVNFAIYPWGSETGQGIANHLAMMPLEDQVKHLALGVAAKLGRAIRRDTAEVAVWQEFVKLLTKQDRKTQDGKTDDLLTKEAMSVFSSTEKDANNIVLSLNRYLEDHLQSLKLSTISMETKQITVLRILKCIATTRTTCTTITEELKTDACPLCEFRGVPQTRLRLIVRAVKAKYGSVPPMVPTHRNPKVPLVVQGDLFAESAQEPLKPWVGWFDAVRDELPNCKESKLAPWQVQRLTDKYGDNWLEAILPHLNADSDWFCAPGGKDPAFCITGLLNSVKAVLVEGQNASKPCPTTRIGEDPAFTMVSSDRGVPRAVLITEQYRQSTGTENRVPQTFLEGSPAPSVLANHCGKNRAIMFRTNGEGSDIHVPATEPAPTLTTDNGSKLRCMDHYRVVAFNIRATANIQTFWANYRFAEGKGSAQVNNRLVGNAVPVLLAEAVAKSFPPVMDEPTAPKQPGRSPRQGDPTAFDKDTYSANDGIERTV